MKRTKLTKVLGGKRYNTETATLLADDVCWDGHNFERSGRNTWLYRTPLGAFFSVTSSFWQGEGDTLEPLSDAEAQELYETNLTEHYLEWEQIFGEPEEPVGERGRPTLYDEKMTQTAVWITAEMIAWLKQQPGGMSETIRSLIEKAMNQDQNLA